MPAAHPMTMHHARSLLANAEADLAAAERRGRVAWCESIRLRIRALREIVARRERERAACPVEPGNQGGCEFCPADGGGYNVCR